VSTTTDSRARVRRPLDFAPSRVEACRAVPTQPDAAPIVVAVDTSRRHSGRAGGRQPRSRSRCPARVRLRSPRPVVRAWRAVLPAPPRRRDGVRAPGTHRRARGRGGSRRACNRRAARRETRPTCRRVRAVAWRAAGRARLASTTPAPRRGERRHPYRGSTCPGGRRHGAGRVAGLREMGVRSGPDRCSYP
jgi:hypothetical protein